MIKRIFKYPLPLILTFAVILRLPLLNGSFWMDEAAQALESIRPLSQQLDIVADFQPPLLHYILHFATYISVNEWFLRTVGALIPGILSIFYTYKIARHLFNREIAIMSSLLLATSSFHIYFSQELRPYALPTALATASMYFFIKFVTSSKKGTSEWAGLTITNALGLYSSYLYPFFMISQFVTLLLLKKFKKRFSGITSLVLSAISFLPILPLFLQQLGEGGAVREQLPGWDLVVSIPQLKAIPLVFSKLIFGVVPIDPSIFVIGFSTLLVAAALGFVYSFAPDLSLRKNRFKTFHLLTKKVRLDTWFTILLSWLVVPLTSAWLISFAVPVVRPKRLLFILPAMYLFVALCASVLKLKKIKYGWILFFFIFLSLNVMSTFQYYSQPHLQRENWRELRTDLYQAYSPETTAIVYSFPGPFSPMRWYDIVDPKKTQFTTYATGYLLTNDHPDLKNELKLLSDYRTILVFDYLRDLTDPQRKIESTLQELGYIETAQIETQNIGFVREFTHQDAIIGMR